MIAKKLKATVAAGVAVAAMSFGNAGTAEASAPCASWTSGNFGFARCDGFLYVYGLGGTVAQGYAHVYYF